MSKNPAAPKLVGKSAKQALERFHGAILNSALNGNPALPWCLL
jgi:hypothetical protein